MLMKSEVRPIESIVQKVRRSMGAVFSMFFWKNFVGKSSWLGAFPLGNEVMASTTSSRLNSWVICTFMSSETRRGNALPALPLGFNKTG